MNDNKHINRRCSMYYPDQLDHTNTTNNWYQMELARVDHDQERDTDALTFIVCMVEALLTLILPMVLL